MATPFAVEQFNGVTHDEPSAGWSAHRPMFAAGQRGGAGNAVSPPGRPKGEFGGAKHEGTPVSTRPRMPKCPAREARGSSPAVRAKAHSALRVLALLLWAAQVPAGAATVYRWVDEQGKTHYSESVPEPYRQTAKPLSAPSTGPTEAQRHEAQDRADRERQRAAAIGNAAPTPSPKPASQPGRASSTPVAKRPAQVPDEHTDCTTWARLYQESLDCFGPYRTTRGATRVEAFSHCRPVDEPPLRCRQRLPD